jgi:hypothetical protein
MTESFLNKTSTSASGQLTIQWHENPTYFLAIYRDLKNVTIEEYMEHLELTGNWMKEARCGKIVADFALLSNYSLPLRAAAVKNLGDLVLKKVPYFLVSIVRSKSAFDNLGTQAALNAAKSLYRKLLDGKTFNDRNEAIQWLTNFPIPEEFK